MENSAIGNTAVPRRIFSSKLEVKPDKTDKTDADIKDKYFDLFDWFVLTKYSRKITLMKRNILISNLSPILVGN